MLSSGLAVHALYKSIFKGRQRRADNRHGHLEGVTPGHIRRTQVFGNLNTRAYQIYPDIGGFIPWDTRHSRASGGSIAEDTRHPGVWEVYCQGVPNVLPGYLKCRIPRRIPHTQSIRVFQTRARIPNVPVPSIWRWEYPARRTRVIEGATPEYTRLSPVLESTIPGVHGIPGYVESAVPDIPTVPDILLPTKK